LTVKKFEINFYTHSGI